MDEHLSFMGYSISGTELQSFFDYFREHHGGKPCQSYDGVPYVVVSPDFLDKYPERIVDVEPITSIFEEYESLKGRKNIVYGIHLERKIRNSRFKDMRYTVQAWKEFDRLVTMYEYKYGKQTILYDNKLPDEKEIDSKTILKLKWKDVESLSDSQRKDMCYFYDFLYGKVVMFSNEVGRIYIGQKYSNDELHIVYVDNGAEKIAKDEYNFVKSI